MGARFMKNVFQNLKKDMKSIFKIYKRDIRNIYTNYVALIIILALTILPSLYAWFNIKASWDPYGNTKNLSVAVVNLDEGSEFRNVKINVGNDMIKKLKDNQSIGWKFVSQSEAQNGVKTGKYYASITITKDFSENLLSIAKKDTPKKAELIYAVNEKINAIAPKITQKGITSLQEEITRSFIQTCSDTVLSYINQFGVDLEHIKPQLQGIIDIILDIDNKMPEVGRDIDNAYAGSLVLQQYVQNVQKNVPVISDTLNKTTDIAKTSNEVIGKATNSLQTISPVIKADLALIKSSTDTAKALLNGAKSFEASDSGKIREVLATVSSRYSDGIERLSRGISLLQSINKTLNNNVIANFIGQLQSTKNQMTNQKAYVDSMISSIDYGKQVLPENIDAAIDGANKVSDLTGNMINNFDSVTAPAIESTMKNFAGISNNTLQLLQNAQQNIPLVDSLLQGVKTGTDIGVKGLKEVKDKFPTVQNDIHSNADKLRSLSGDKKFDEIVRILKRDAKAESDFLSDPVEIKQDRIFPIPNYGSAMAPFYTILALWVGAFILLSLLSVEVKSFDDGLEIKAGDQFFGRYLTFVTIGIMQAFVVTMGNLFLLKTYVSAPFIYVLYGIYVSIIFSMIIYTLVSVFGNVGKALVMIGLVLQVSASGGTFPIELTPSFFRYINPLLPFTYAIGGMREAVGGILRNVLIHNMTILSLYFIASILIGIFLKEKVNKIGKKFVHQFKESGLVE